MANDVYGLVGLIVGVLFALAFSQWVAVAHLPSRPSGAEPEARRHYRQAQTDKMPSSGEGEQRSAYDPGCPYPQNREDADLCEQRSMAQAAKETVALADAQYRWNIAQAAATVVAALAAGLAAIYAGNAAKAASRSADISETTLKITQRAYVSVEPLGIRERKGADAWVGHVGIRNAGLLPARDVRWKISIERFGTDKDWKGFLYVHPYRGNHVIPTGTTMRRGSDPFSVGTIGDLQELWMYVWGEVTYTDGFGKERFTKFCHRYNNQAIVPDGKGRHWIPPEDARHHDHGNEAT